MILKSYLNLAHQLLLLFPIPDQTHPLVADNQSTMPLTFSTVWLLLASSIEAAWIIEQGGYGSHIQIEL